MPPADKATPFAGSGERASARAIRAALASAGVFELLALYETQNKKAWQESPWGQDPYHTAVLLAVFAVPMLALAIGLRLLAWRAPGAPDRAQQTVRAAGVMTAFIGLTLVSEWAALPAGALVGPWTGLTTAQVIGLVATTLLTAAVTVLLVRCRSPRRSSRRWEHDWLGDVVYLLQRVPVLRRWASPRAAEWARRHAMAVFVTLSVLAAAVITVLQVLGEGWTNTLLVVWILVAETASNIAFCVISNALAGFIARPPRTRPRRIAETSLVAGCVAVLLAIGFHDGLWSLIGTGDLTVVGLVSLTFGAGAVTSLVTAAILLARAPRAWRRETV
jgi:hypothetical protein